jgi:putative sigma-54 modulation protein
MRIDVIGRHIEVTPPIREYAETKASKLLKLFDGTQAIRVIIESPVGKTKEFKVEIEVDVVKHEDFVASSHGPDLYACIDEAVDRAQRQLRDFKEMLRK